jgi:hypothetical protein
VIIGDLPVEVLFRRANLADSLDQFVEVVVPPPSLFQSLVIQSEALHDELAQPLSSPDPKLRAAVGADAVPD